MSEKEKSIRELKSRMLSDKSLPLRKGATNLVFGDGDPDTEIIFIGEGPGYWEDKKGIPFVGNAGALLNQLLATINFKREDVFSLGDAGLRRAIKNLYKIEKDADILKLAEKWKPKRSFACWYLWRSLENR